MLEKPIPITKEFEEELFEQRVLVFIEGEPQSNKYRQVLLTPEEYFKMTETLGTPTICEHGNEIMEMNESDEEYDLPDLKSHMPKKLST